MLFTELSVLYALFLCIVVCISVSVFFLTTTLTMRVLSCHTTGPSYMS